MKGFPAEYPGTCGDCDEKISPGDMICTVMPERYYVHAACANDLLTIRHTVICPECWLAQPCEHTE